MRDERNLECELEGLLDDLSPLEKALILASAFREVFGSEWVIDGRPDGGFSITEALPKAKKTP